MFYEGEWLKKFETLIENSIEKKLSITRLITRDPVIILIEKKFIQELIEFLLTIYPEQNLHLCFNKIRELSREERKNILKEAHKEHLGENKTLDRAKNIEYLNRMDKEIIEYVKKFPICQLEKTTRIKKYIIT